MSIKEGDLVKSSWGWSVVKEIEKPAIVVGGYNLKRGVNVLITEPEIQEVVKSENIAGLVTVLTSEEKSTYEKYIDNKKDRINQHIHIAPTSVAETSSVEDNNRDEYNITYTCVGSSEYLSINDEVVYSREGGITKVEFDLHYKEDVLSLVEDIVPRLRKVKHEE